MAEFNRPRRYYLLKRLWAKRYCENSEHVWRAKQEAEPGTSLPVGFPALSTLAEAGYTTVEDLDGADAAELKLNTNLGAPQSAAVLAALEALL